VTNYSDRLVSFIWDVVAFSGSLIDPDDPTEEELTEVKMNE
jgi:hypothetical protein